MKANNFPVHAQNPFGIHFLKFFISVTLIALHALVFVATFSKYKFDTSNELLIRLLGLLPAALLVPITAGATQGILLRSQISTARLENYSLKPIAKIVVFLAFLESLKAGIVYMPAVFFAWNVMHMLAVSLIVVLFLARFSIHLVWLSSLLCILATPFLRVWLARFQVATMAQAGLLNEYGMAPLFLATTSLAMLLLYLGIIWQNKWLAAIYRYRLAMIGILIFSIYLLLIPHIKPEYYYAARIFNLPVGALVGDQLGLHYWPIFPWYSNVAFGFWLYIWLDRTSRPLLLRRFLLGVGVMGLIVFSIFCYPAVIAEMDNHFIWSAELFKGHLPLLLYVFSYFLVFALVCDKMSNSQKFNNLIKKYPLLYRIPFVYSKTIFWSYLFINSFGIGLAFVFAKFLPKNLSIFVFPISMVVFWFWIGEKTIHWFSQVRFDIRLRPAKVFGEQRCLRN